MKTSSAFMVFPLMFPRNHTNLVKVRWIFFETVLLSQSYKTNQIFQASKTSAVNLIFSIALILFSAFIYSLLQCRRRSSVRAIRSFSTTNYRLRFSNILLFGSVCRQNSTQKCLRYCKSSSVTKIVFSFNDYHAIKV